MDAFIIGNGTSRANFDLQLLVDKGTTYACNAIYKEFVPDILISVDPGISREIQNSGYSKEHKHITRKPIPNLGAVKVDNTAWGWSSGPVAFWYAVNDTRIQRIFLLGFDFIGIPQKNNDKRLHNNMYSGEEFYKKANTPETHYGNWVTQMHQAMNEIDRNYKVIRVGGFGNYIPEKLVHDERWREITYEQFAEMINI